jgi:uncharacterized membrane protein
VALVVSLALNCLLIGAIAARWYTHERMERFSGASYTQLVPRRFLGQLSAERRRELMAIMGSHRKEFRDGRAALGKAALTLSEALSREPYDKAAVDAAIDGFGSEAAGLIEQGSKVAREIIAVLSPEERRRLAQRIRERAEGRKSGGPPD